MADQMMTSWMTSRDLERSGS